VVSRSPQGWEKRKVTAVTLKPRRHTICDGASAPALSVGCAMDSMRFASAASACAFSSRYLVPVVYTSNAIYGVAEDALGNIGVNACTRHERASRAP